MVEVSRTDQRPPSSRSMAARTLELIASGEAASRTELAARLGAPASTISVIVRQLVERGLVEEFGTHASTGGRPRKLLRLGSIDEVAVAADLGIHHARVGVVRQRGVESAATVPFRMDAGPEDALSDLARTLQELVAGDPAATIRAIGLSIPGPVDPRSGSVNLPSRMPGWNGFPVRQWIEDRLELPASVENDANCMAVAEQHVHPAGHQHSITVKAGSAIGAGIMVGGSLYRGATGAAGDVTHVRIDAAGEIPCSCGNTGCLETVASGAGIVRTLRSQGIEVADTDDVIRLTGEAEPSVTRAVRQAGKYLGEVLSANVNFFNPHAVYLGGLLSTLEPFVAAVRSQLYEGSHPLVTRQLVIERSSLGEDSGLMGAGLLALREVVDRLFEAPNTATN